MTVATRYNLYKAGKITKEMFLYEVRKDSSVPFITPLTSFNDAITMLKQRRIVVENFEAPIQEAGDPYEQGFMAAEKGDDYQDCPFMQDENPEEYEAWCDGWSDASAKSESAGDEEIPAGLSAADDQMIGDYEEDMANSEMGKHMSDMYKEGEGGGKFAILNSKGGRQVDKTFDSQKDAADYMRNNPSMHGKSAGLKIVQLSSNPKVYSNNEGLSLREQVQEFVQTAMEGGSSMDEAKEQAREYFSTEKAAMNEAVGNFELKKLAREFYSVIKPIKGVQQVQVKTSNDILKTKSGGQGKPFTAGASKPTSAMFDGKANVYIEVHEKENALQVVIGGEDKLMEVAQRIDQALTAFVMKNYKDQLQAEYGKSNDGSLVYITARLKQPTKEAYSLNEAAKPKLGIDQVNPYELKKGTDYEMGYATKPAPSWAEMTLMDIAGDVAKAQAKVLKNLNKDPMYYTRLLANGGKKEKKTTEKKVQSDGYLKAKAPKVVKEGIKTSVQKIREFVTGQLKKETQLVKSATTGATIDVIPDAQANQMKADLQRKGVKTTSVKV